MTGAELKAWREHINGDGHKMLQQDLADKLELHRRTIQSWEARDEVSLLVRLALAALEKRIEPLGGW